jgi:hypothetical protein
MSVDDEDDSTPMMGADPEIKELMGLFDLPAFARRGQDLEYALRRVHERCRAQREEQLEMVRMRLRQWTRVADGPEDWSGVFSAPLEALCRLALADDPDWARQPAPPRQRRTVARDLIASVQRFNQRWRLFLESLNVGPTNAVIDLYNQYYVLEKECVMGSARLAARHFTPVPRLNAEVLLRDYPLLPVPALADAPGR